MHVGMTPVKQNSLKARKYTCTLIYPIASTSRSVVPLLQI